MVYAERVSGVRIDSVKEQMVVAAQELLRRQHDCPFIKAQGRGPHR